MIVNSLINKQSFLSFKKNAFSNDIILVSKNKKRDKKKAQSEIRKFKVFQYFY